MVFDHPEYMNTLFLRFFRQVPSVKPDQLEMRTQIVWGLLEPLLERMRIIAGQLTTARQLHLKLVEGLPVRLRLLRSQLKRTKKNESYGCDASQNNGAFRTYLQKTASRCGPRSGDRNCFPM
jgi:hypothetical protein